MSNETVTYSLESVLKEIKDSIKEVNQKIDTLQKDVNQKIDTLQKDVNQKIDSLETRMDERFDKVEDRLTKVEIGQAELKGELKGNIKVLDEKIEGLTVRVGYQEFTNRGILIALVVAVLGGAAKLFGFFPNP
jgi:Skp family chaperone for outer membrane proteins